MSIDYLEKIIRNFDEVLGIIDPHQLRGHHPRKESKRENTRPVPTTLRGKRRLVNFVKLVY